MRIAIVNDMVIAVEAMRRLLLQDNGHQLAWVARDGAEAVERCARDTPDLVLMDLVMPEMDGVEATRRIMARNPCAIVVVTASVNRYSSKVFEAMGAGALDAVKTPSMVKTGAFMGAQAFLGKIQTIDRLIGPRTTRQGHPGHTQHRALRPVRRPPLVAIGASAGGPGALAALLKHLPQDFPGAIVVVQHVDVQFAGGFADWLGSQTRLPVRLAREGDRLQAGTVLIAGSDSHLVFTGPGRLSYTPQPADSPYRPSVDVLFKSIHRFWHGRVIGVLLTGMGKDGAQGLKALRNAGHHTLAQDEATSAVYGMPKAAFQMNAATEILPLDKIGPRLSSLLAHRHHAHA